MLNSAYIYYAAHLFIGFANFQLLVSVYIPLTQALLIHVLCICACYCSVTFSPPESCVVEFTVNVLKFQTLFSFCSQIIVGLQGWNSQNACQISKQGRP